MNCGFCGWQHEGKCPPCSYCGDQAHPKPSHGFKFGSCPKQIEARTTGLKLIRCSMGLSDKAMGRK